MKDLKVNIFAVEVKDFTGTAEGGKKADTLLKSAVAYLEDHRDAINEMSAQGTTSGGDVRTIMTSNKDEMAAWLREAQEEHSA